VCGVLIGFGAGGTRQSKTANMVGTTEFARGTASDPRRPRNTCQLMPVFFVGGVVYIVLSVFIRWD